MNDAAAAATLPSIRDAAPADLAGIAAIYAHHVLTGLGTFEETPPTVEEMTRRHADVVGRGLPWIVAVAPPGGILGYAYAAPYRLRSAYRYTLEDSIYVAPTALRHGVGLALLHALVERCTVAGYRQMIAIIGDSDNRASIGVHSRAGFARIGVMPGVGHKHGRWVDCVVMQRTLGSGDGAPP
jgi:phosphinothricin acetyltransferase